MHLNVRECGQSNIDMLKINDKIDEHNSYEILQLSMLRFIVFLFLTTMTQHYVLPLCIISYIAFCFLFRDYNQFIALKYSFSKDIFFWKMCFNSFLK